MTTGTVANPLAPGIVPVSSTSMNSNIFVDSKDTVKTVSSEDESSPSAEDEQNTIIHRPSHEHNTIDNNNEESDEMAFLATEEERIMKQDEENKEAEVFPDKCISSRNTNEADQTNGKTTNNNLSSKRVKIVEPVKDSEEGAVPVKMEEDNIEKVTHLTGRSRIDSIDLDSHNFDFGDMGIDLGNNQDTTSQAAEDAPAPSSALENDKKTTSALPSIRKFSVSEETIEMALRDHHTPGDGSSTGRGRGFSIDFFAFGMNEDEPIPNNGSAAATATPHSSSNGGDEAGKVLLTNRPRGDSIIFDPSSFGEGGIHEENALKGSHLMPLTSEVDEMEIMNAPGFSEAQPDMHTSTSHPISEIIIPHGARKRTTRVAPSPTMNPQSQQQSPYICDIPVSCSAPATTVDLNNKGSCVGANTTTSNVVPNNTHTSSTAANTTTTSSSGMTLPIQFELLNKGGRIGMYLPHERKDRIAKFHSKRKLRIWRKRIKYDCRKKLADSRPRIKGRFVKRSDLEED